MLFTKGFCPICESGNVGFRRCNDGMTIVLMCDECNATWLSPDNIESSKALFPKGPDFLIPVSISGENSGWATKKEISFYNWDEFVEGRTVALDEEE